MELGGERRGQRSRVGSEIRQRGGLPLPSLPAAPGVGGVPFPFQAVPEGILVALDLSPRTAVDTIRKNTVGVCCVFIHVQVLGRGGRTFAVCNMFEDPSVFLPVNSLVTFFPKPSLAWHESTHLDGLQLNPPT